MVDQLNRIMTSRRVIKGILHNFLGTFTSRHSDFGGYWLFGFLLHEIDTLHVDLLVANAEEPNVTPSVFARRLATQKFAEQIAKAGLPRPWLREAHLSAAKSAVEKPGVVNGRTCPGYEVIFRANAVTDLGKVYESTMSVFVAPHNPKIELRSTRVATSN
jgi:hypothetical protein